MQKKKDIYKYQLNNSESYYRRYVTLDYVMLVVIILLTLSGFGIIISLPLALVYPRIDSLICVSKFDDPSQRYWVKKEDWNNYRQSHDISIFAEYRNVKRVISNPEPLVGEADQIIEYKKLLDNGAITKEEFDAKKKQILGLK